MFWNVFLNYLGFGKFLKFRIFLTINTYIFLIIFKKGWYIFFFDLGYNFGLISIFAIFFYLIWDFERFLEFSEILEI